MITKQPPSPGKLGMTLPGNETAMMTLSVDFGDTRVKGCTLRFDPSMSTMVIKPGSMQINTTSGNRPDQRTCNKPGYDEAVEKALGALLYNTPQLIALRNQDGTERMVVNLAQVREFQVKPEQNLVLQFFDGTQQTFAAASSSLESALKAAASRNSEIAVLRTADGQKIMIADMSIISEVFYPETAAGSIIFKLPGDMRRSFVPSPDSLAEFKTAHAAFKQKKNGGSPNDIVTRALKAILHRGQPRTA